MLGVQGCLPTGAIHLEEATQLPNEFSIRTVPKADITHNNFRYYNKAAKHHRNDFAVMTRQSTSLQSYYYYNKVTEHNCSDITVSTRQRNIITPTRHRNIIAPVVQLVDLLLARCECELVKRNPQLRVPVFRGHNLHNAVLFTVPLMKKLYVPVLRPSNKYE